MASREFYLKHLSEPFKELFPGSQSGKGAGKIIYRLPLCVGASGIAWLLACSFFSLSELETDLKVFKETILEILDEEELIEELCLSKWTDPQVLYVYYETRYFL